MCVVHILNCLLTEGKHLRNGTLSLKTGLNGNFLLKFHTGNLQCLLAKLNAISDLNPIDCVIWEMSIFSLKLALKAFMLLHFGCTSSPRCALHGTVTSKCSQLCVSWV
ncbi:unnamed protein product [Rangifer tarandus platyrhynchus]|uniref:Uncharacterized protein n=1 Tax=Rangifer tarandus platyrhynchus TaxID=3082113 RepID=A0ABN8XN89_RANTA|nr:unnamed protein product [Rangifer tarandus platyrhynchus]CAI9180110.1 unnamed protein product [Rangifer tarandus platyrhynchus]